MTAADAARLLGVRRATLYAYVSRGRVRSQPTAGATRERVYARDDLERLKRRAEERREPGTAAARALEWGLPLLESSIALIDGERLYYRGVDVESLARTRSVDEVAGLIWNAGPTPLARPPLPFDRRALRGSHAFVPRAQRLLAAAAAADPLAWDRRPAHVVAAGYRILRLLTNAATGARVGRRSVDEALAASWRVPARGLEIVRSALILCADHELNVSSFTARCVASAGSHPYAVVIAGLAALEGPKHGGASARAEAMLASVRRARSLHAAVGDRVQRGESIDGFGHPLYRHGDPRARLLLALLRDGYGHSAEYRYIETFAEAASGVTGELPNIDFALAAAARVVALPGGSPLVLFAIGRSIGWIGHALEQYASGQLIRPRARYVGPPPSAFLISPSRDTL